MKFGQFYVALPLFDPNEPGGAPAPAAPSAPAAPTGGQPSAPAPSAPVGGAPAAPAAPPNAPAGFTYKEDRSNWVPSHVVRQNTDRIRQMENDLLLERQRVAALSGVKPPTAPRNPEHDQIRNQLYEVAPELRELADLKDKLKELTGLDLNEIKQIRSSQDQVWQAHGNSVLRTLTEKVKAAYGGAELSPKALQRVARAFVAEVGEDEDLRQRYEAGDLSIIDEFVKDYTGAVLDPYRRTANVAQNQQHNLARRLPRGGGSSAIVGAPPQNLKPTDPGYHEAAFKRFSQG